MTDAREKFPVGTRVRHYRNGGGTVVGHRAMRGQWSVVGYALLVQLDDTSYEDGAATLVYPYEVEILGGDLADMGSRTDVAKRLLIAFGVGGVAAGLLSWWSTTRLRAEFGASAEELRDHLMDEGSSLRTEIVAAATRAGREAAVDALNEYGITPALIADLGRTIALANELETIAIRTGKSVQEIAALAAAGARRALAP